MTFKRLRDAAQPMTRTAQPKAIKYNRDDVAAFRESFKAIDNVMRDKCHNVRSGSKIERGAFIVKGEMIIVDVARVPANSYLRDEFCVEYGVLFQRDTKRQSDFDSCLLLGSMTQPDEPDSLFEPTSKRLQMIKQYYRSHTPFAGGIVYAIDAEVTVDRSSLFYGVAI